MQRAATPSDRTTSRRAPATLLLFAAALVLRVAWVVLTAGPGAAPGPSSAHVDEVATHLAEGSGFTLGAPPRATAEIPPLTPWMTSLVYQGFGHRFFVALLVQCLVGALVPLMIAALGRSLFGDPAGLWSGWLVAVHPLLIVACAELTPATTFCAALALALLLAAEWMRTPRHARAFGSGLAWGLTALAHPAALVAPLIVTAWAWRPLGLAVGAPGRLRQLGLILLGAMLVVGPWTLRNVVQTHAVSLVAHGDGGPLTGAFDAAAWTPGKRGAETQPGSGPPAARDDRGTPATPARDTGALPIPLLVWMSIAAPLALWGLVCTLRSGRRWFQSLPFLIILSLGLMSAGFTKRPDLRLPVGPLAAVYAAFGLEEARRMLRVRRSGLTVVRGRGGSERPGGR